MGICALCIGAIAGWLGARRSILTPAETKAGAELLIAEIDRLKRERDQAKQKVVDVVSRLVNEREAMKVALKGANSAEVDRQLVDLGLRK